MGEITLLSEKNIFLSEIDIIRKLGKKCAISDLGIVLGGLLSSENNLNDDNPLKGRSTVWATKSSSDMGNVICVEEDGSQAWSYAGLKCMGIRPVIPYQCLSNYGMTFVINKNGIKEITYGEYPQYAVNIGLEEILEKEYQSDKLIKTGRGYTIGSRSCDFFKAENYDEYEYNGKRYIRIINYRNRNCDLSNDKTYNEGNKVWLEVSPIEWYVDEETKLLVSKICLTCGIRFCLDYNYNNNFEETEVYDFLNNYFKKEIVQTEKNLIKTKNPFNLKFNELTEEGIIKGAIESNVPVFLHGPSSEGKSARVKQIDPNCEIIYLRNATPESLNGKSVYNQSTGEMKDIPPTWLKKVKDKCLKEPDKLHIIFFDELTNALPSIQGMAFNIILDREVNGIWKLPKNARIVASGNEMSDSLAANQLAEPLFNRFAHVYIKTTVSDWLKWASENNIHPAIYTYIAYKKEAALRSKYDGKSPNADPTKMGNGL